MNPNEEVQVLLNGVREQLISRVERAVNADGERQFDAWAEAFRAELKGECRNEVVAEKYELLKPYLNQTI